ncbi:MAG: hypothetical protein AAF485_04010 [Chloroflexota bacterium]
MPNFIKNTLIPGVLIIALLTTFSMFVISLLTASDSSPVELPSSSETLTETPELQSTPNPTLAPLTDTDQDKPVTDFQARWLSQTHDTTIGDIDYLSMMPDQKRTIELVVENAGRIAWEANEVVLVTHQPTDPLQLGTACPTVNTDGSTYSIWADLNSWQMNDQGDREVSRLDEPLEPGQSVTLQVTFEANPETVDWFTSCNDYFRLVRQTGNTLVPVDNSEIALHFLGAPLAEAYQASVVGMASPTHDLYYDYATRQYNVVPGETIEFELAVKNIGETDWVLDSETPVTLNLFKVAESGASSPNSAHDVRQAIGASFADYCQTETPLYGKSYFYHESWLDYCRLSQVRAINAQKSVIAPGEAGVFNITLQIPDETPPGRYVENMVLAIDSNWIAEPETGSVFGAVPLAHTQIRLNVLVADKFIYPVGDDIEDHTGYEILDIPAGGADCHFAAPCTGSRDHITSDQSVHVGEDWVKIEVPVFNYCEPITDPFPFRGPYEQQCDSPGCFCGGNQDSYNQAVRAVANGSIIRVGYNEKEEYYTILVRHTLLNGETYYSFYVHVDKPDWLRSDEPWPWDGDRPVRIGEPISRIVSLGHIPPGYEIGLESHLHFSILTEDGYQFYKQRNLWTGYIDGREELKYWLRPCEFIVSQNPRLELSPSCKPFG